MQTIFRLLGKGLLVLLPFGILIWLLSFIFGIVSYIVQFIFNTTSNSIWGTVLVLMFTCLTLIYAGYLFEKNRELLLLKFSEFLIAKIPGIGVVYSILKDMVKMFSGGGDKDYLGVVFVDLAGHDVVGFITKEEEEVFWVFVPTTPNPTSGILLRVPKDKIRKTEMSVSDGLKKVVSLGLK
ncbi:DUF502 domain-containing protein [Helicobacter mustelae]|uniref:Putative inner membrane protein n=1 Tax=Helicobacter mustelae (strain ATCC 43772 / CCUG 25715 / CIP 103759 / LMG 18044 / NCTC 12198 / R85-136P) TaxID=679897 RepID=D3UJ08_HELM1|nr:DUF502 domain-containing protein [Helicobacter mustelae]CBG40483.1 putative inner membrane protein [Helicobacter mustelae 12198]SQH71982.1 Uncharacterized conserved protein [Helicobacter mustelae]STP13125.1 Uncharacterized conserved protein [Helicobacter mustelae]